MVLLLYFFSKIKKHNFVCLILINVHTHKKSHNKPSCQFQVFIIGGIHRYETSNNSSNKHNLSFIKRGEKKKIFHGSIDFTTAISQ